MIDMNEMIYLLPCDTFLEIYETLDFLIIKAKTYYNRDCHMHSCYEITNTQ